MGQPVDDAPVGMPVPEGRWTVLVMVLYSVEVLRSVVVLVDSAGELSFLWGVSNCAGEG
jgi:hypothetical protein